MGGMQNFVLTPAYQYHPMLSRIAKHAGRSSGALTMQFSAAGRTGSQSQGSRFMLFWCLAGRTIAGWKDPRKRPRHKHTK